MKKKSVYQWKGWYADFLCLVCNSIIVISTLELSS